MTDRYDVEFRVPGEIIPQGRPRFSTASGYARAYDPIRSRIFKKKVSTHAALAMGGMAPLEGPTGVQIIVDIKIPESWSKKKQARAVSGELRPTSGGRDVDNLAKSIMDGMTGIVYKDDAQIVSLSVSKRYGEEEGASIFVWSPAKTREADDGV